MKKLAFLFVALILFPAMLSAQYKVKAIHQEPVDLKVTIPGYNDRVPAAVMNARFEFDQETETLLIRFNKGNTNCEYNKIWLPQHDVIVKDMGSYMKTRGVKLKKAQTFINQEDFQNLTNRTLSASIQTKGMTFNGVYDLKSKKKVKKQLDHQMVPLDGKMELDLSFKTDKKSRTATLTLRNPIPMNRKGSKGTVACVAQDVTITIELGRCKDAEQNILAIQDLEAMFEAAEKKLNSMKKTPTTQKAYADFALNMYKAIDLDRYEEMSCDDIQDSYENLTAIGGRIEKMAGQKPINSGDGGNDDDDKKNTKCDVKKLNDEIKSTTTKLNNLVNDWSMASDAASKAEKKNAFNAMVQSFDDKLNSLPAGCKKQLDAKLLKNYEFVKKLIK